MDTRKALATLNRPQFGNDEQIRAIHYLEDVEAARVAFGKCRHRKNCVPCNGKGFLRIRGARDVCDFCDGSGAGYGCSCFEGLDPDAIMEARR